MYNATAAVTAPARTIALRKCIGALHPCAFNPWRTGVTHASDSRWRKARAGLRRLRKLGKRRALDALVQGRVLLRPLLQLSGRGRSHKGLAGPYVGLVLVYPSNLIQRINVSGGLVASDVLYPWKPQRVAAGVPWALLYAVKCYFKHHLRPHLKPVAVA